MPEMTGAQVVARVLKEEGVEFWAGIVGASFFEILKATDKEDIRMLHMRDEQTGPYLADGYARVTGKVGVCFCDAHYGMVNTVSSLSHCFFCRSPIVMVTSGRVEGRSPDQYVMSQSWEITKHFTKWSKRIPDWNSISYYIHRAFTVAQQFPPGPVVIEVPVDIQRQVGDLKNQLDYIAPGHTAPLGEFKGDEASVEKAVRQLMEAERPVVVGGEDIYWSDACEELRQFVELLQIPVHTRRLGRGAVSEDHPLAYRGAYAIPFNRKADILAGIGLVMGPGETFGQRVGTFGAPPSYNVDGKYILVSQLLEDLNAPVYTEGRILGNPKTVLKQMIECAKDLKKSKAIKEPPAKKQWLDALVKAKEEYRSREALLKEQVKNASPINPHLLAQEICDYLDPEGTIIEDSMYLSHFTSPKFIARMPARVLDAAGSIGVGHSIGMALGAQLGRPGKQVVALVGDGGFGISGMDLETASRYSLPAVFVLNNNSGWTSPETQKPFYKGAFALPIKDSFEMLPDIRYDKMFMEMGCHGEFVTEPQQIRPALERAFNSGKPALLNVVTDHKVFPPFVMRLTRA